MHYYAVLLGGRSPSDRKRSTFSWNFFFGYQVYAKNMLLCTKTIKINIYSRLNSTARFGHRVPKGNSTLITHFYIKQRRFYVK
jgi:hypothetical protein